MAKKEVKLRQNKISKFQQHSFGGQFLNSIKFSQQNRGVIDQLVSLESIKLKIHK